MSSHGDQLKSAIGITALVSFYGIASLVIWFLGPQFGLGYGEQIVLIALLLLTFPFILLFNYFRKKRRLARENAGGAATPSKKAKGSTAPARVYEELSGAAEEAVQWLRSSQLGDKHSKTAVYALPWFLVAGPPGSGKTSLLLSSGLDLQTLPSQRSAEQHIIRPTRNCEWRVTTEAVLLDTAGRYQAEGPVREEWDALIETVKRHREARPLDGLLVVVSTERMLKSSETEVEEQAKILRSRLDEVLHLSGTRFPIYLVFAQADSIEGFREFYKPFNTNGRAQVWGATIPLEKSSNAHALFDAEFDLLFSSLMRKRLARLGISEPAGEQLQVFDFPFNFDDARSKLGLFTSVLFRPNPFSGSPLLRGFYLTANVRDSSGLAPPTGVSPGEEAAQSVGRAFFTHRLFKEVLLSDKGLATSLGVRKTRRVSWQGIALGVAALLMLLLVAGMAVSFIGNRTLVRAALERGTRVDEITRADVGKDPTKKSPAEARIEIEAVDQLRETLTELDEYNHKSPPLRLRFGLYSGNNLIPELRTIYFDSTEQRFKKPTVAALELDLRAFAAGAPTAGVNGGEASSNDSQSRQESTGLTEDVLGRHYDLLKAYLMLGDASKVEPTFLADQLAGYWKKFSPPEMETASQQQLNFLAHLLQGEDAPHIKVDDKLVGNVRRKLVAYPAVNRVYKRLTTEVNAKAQPISLDSILEGRNRGVLVGAATVPGSYTIEGYRKFIRPRMESAGGEISKEDWVMGSQASDTKDQSADIGKLQNMYFRDYADQWRKLVKGVNVKEYKTKDDAVEVLKSMSSSDSPMERVMVAVEHHTNFSAKPKSAGWWDWFKGLFARSTSEDTGGSSEPEKEFRPVIQFVAAGDKKDSTPPTQYRAALRAVLDPLQGASQSQLQQTSEALLTGKDELGLQKAEQAVDNLIDNFKSTAAGSDTAALLKQPLANLRALLYGSGYAVIEKTWREQIYPQAHSLESGFPFTDSGESSVTDLARFLNPVNGQFTTFFNKQLAPSFEEVSGEWKLKESGAVRFSEDFIKYINNLRRLRDALFPSGSAQPEVRYGIELQSVPNTDMVIEIDGQRVESAGTKSASFVWPARPGSPTGAAIKVMQNGGAVSSGSAGQASVGKTPVAPQPSGPPPTQTAEAQPLTFSGEWGLFKMFAAGSPAKSGDNQFTLTWNTGAVPVHAILRPSSASNPFNRGLFTSLHAPPGLQK